MLDITVGPSGELVFTGRLDAVQAEQVKDTILGLTESKTLDFSGLDYISSAGLGILLAAQKNLNETGQAIRLVNVKAQIRDIFHFSGFDQIFEIR